MIGGNEYPKIKKLACIDGIIRIIRYHVDFHARSQWIQKYSTMAKPFLLISIEAQKLSNLKLLDF